MVIKTNKGMFKVIKNAKNALDITAFEDKYIEECFDMYPYIVGDISSGILRLKGFSTNTTAKNYFKRIDEYIYDSCAFRCPVFILQRIETEDEFSTLMALNEEPIGEEVKVFTLVKENYDKENIILESNPSVKPNMVIDINRINSIPRHKLPDDLEAIKQAEEALFNKNQNRKQNQFRPNNQGQNRNNDNNRKDNRPNPGNPANKNNNNGNNKPISSNNKPTNSNNSSNGNNNQMANRNKKFNKPKQKKENNAE